MQGLRPWLLGLAAVALVGLGVALGEMVRPPVETAPTSRIGEPWCEEPEDETRTPRGGRDAEPGTGSAPRLQGAPVDRPRRGGEIAVPAASAAAGAPAIEPEPEAPSAPVFPASLSVLDVIRALGKVDARQKDTAFVSAGPAFAARFQSKTRGEIVSGDERSPTAALEDGTTIALGEGMHDYATFSTAHRGRFPGDVTFRGRGRDRTLLILHEVGATGEIRNLAFEDLTLDTRGHYLADVRGDEPVSLRFDRVRVIGFDPAPDGAVLLAARHGAVLARDARFEAGFGGAPGKGSLFHVRGPFLVRFERCTFQGAFLSLYEKSEKAAYAWVDCRFEAMDPARRRDLESPDPNLLFQDCFFDYRLESAEPPGARARSELNPEWK